MAVNAEPLPVVGTMCGKEPYLVPLADALLPVIREFFQNPDNEREFQEWLADQQRKGA
jgi:hypothetical protein